MLNCRQVTERASDMVDGELTSRERLSMRLHLLMCVHCRRFQRHLQSMVSALQSREPWTDQVDPAFVGRLLHSLNNLAEGKDGPRDP